MYGMTGGKQIMTGIKRLILRQISRPYFFRYFFPAENAFSTSFPTPK